MPLSEEEVRTIEGWKMIDTLTGLAERVEPTQIVIEVGGVGFRVAVPLSTSAKVTQGQQTSIFTELVVREDALTLFGFHTEKERRFFNLLRGVAGVGPKLACTVLSGLSVEALNQAITRGEPGLLSKVPGIGRKTAGRIVMELSGKIESVLEGPLVAASSVGEAIHALMSLGFQRNTASKSVERAAKELGQDAAVEDLIRVALKFSSSKGRKE